MLVKVDGFHDVAVGAKIVGTLDVCFYRRTGEGSKKQNDASKPPPSKASENVTLPAPVSKEKGAAPATDEVGVEPGTEEVQDGVGGK